MFLGDKVSYLDRMGDISIQGTKDGSTQVLIQSVRCGDPFHAGKCQDETNKRIKGEFWKMDRLKVRHIMVSYARNEGEDGKSNYTDSVKGKHRNKFMLRLARYLEQCGRNVGRVVCVREWHKDGYQHFHFIMEVSGVGMIGKHKIQELWGHGNVWETYYRTYRDWVTFVGYFDKTGYMDKDKNHQNCLPEWAMDTTLRIRRFEVFGRPLDKPEDEIVDRGASETVIIREETDEKLKNGDEVEFTVKNRFSGLTHRERQARCGEATKLSVIQGRDPSTARIIEYGEIEIPYSWFNNFPWRYVRGFGKVLFLSNREFLVMWKKFAVANKISRVYVGADGKKMIPYPPGAQIVARS